MMEKRKYMRINAYCKESGFPKVTIEQLVHSRLGSRFAKKTGGKANSPWIINTELFEKMWESGEFEPIL